MAAKGQMQTCHCCQSNEVKKSGSYQNKNRMVQRFFCLRCGKTFSESQPLPGIRVETDKAVQIVELLAETVGIRAVSRLARVDLGTVLRVLESAGEHCARFLDAKVRNLTVPIVQADEVYSYVQCQPHIAKEDDTERGEFWTFLSIAKYEKLIINYRVSKRTGEDAAAFLTDLRSRMAMKFQFTTDGFRGYCDHNSSSGNVERILGDVCHYATETKIFKKDPNYTGRRKFFAPEIAKVIRKVRFGYPDMSEATTCHAERTNLSLRTFNRRFVRRTINFSKKVANHRHAVAIFAATFNFCRVHKTLKQTPAMVAGLTDHVWTVAELLATVV
jgi:transposase-like protein/IS1 family transposase